jgi:Fur family transcriptional regulator, peroxide stress response regulator
MEPDDQLYGLFKKTARENGLKVTPQRAAVYGELSCAGDHPSTSAVYKRVRRLIPSISFDTVYRTLLAFTEKGIISMVEGTGEEARFEPNLAAHHHFRCLKCREITDFTDDSLAEIEAPPEIGKKFTVLKKRVVFEGICGACGGKE